MKLQSNPFVRGFDRLCIRRSVSIETDARSHHVHRTLHHSQDRLRDEEIVLRPCIYSDGFVVIIGGPTIATGLADQCSHRGTALGVLYSILADDNGTPFHVGDTYTMEAAEEIVNRLAFRTGHYSRCWEISTAHLPPAALDYLDALALSPDPTGLCFEVFRIPAGHAIGLKLINTPWNDANLECVLGHSAYVLHQLLLGAGVPEALLAVMELAALADTRVLIFDPDAQPLPGLPQYDHR